MEDRRKPSILIADELGIVREGLVMMISAGGNFGAIEQVEDGSAALEYILQRRPDVAVLDLNLPRLYSLEIVRKVREHPIQTRLILLSTRGDRKLVMEALRAGANGFVLKAGPSRNLVDGIHQVLMGSIYVSPELEFEKLFLTSRKQEASDPLDSLSSREYQVFSLLIDGVRAKEIAARLDLSPKTVDTYRASLMRKLDIYDVAGLVKFAIQREITTVHPC